MSKVETKTETYAVEFSFDTLEIIGVIDGRIFIVGWAVQGEEDSEDIDMVKCLVAIDRTLLHISLDHWINDKERLCSLWGHFCGVMGRISSETFDKLEGNYSIYDHELESLVQVDAYEVHHTDMETDMEHG